jgi:hypothetical protein
VLSLLAAGCLATPLAHPLRANDGITAEPQGTVGLFSEHKREANGTGGFNESSGTASGILSGSLGYAHAFGDEKTFGLQGGIFGPARENVKNHSALSAIALYSFFSYQLPILSVGAGPELGYGGFSTTMGLELGPWRDLTLGAYARWFWPFVPAENITDDHRNHEGGFRLRWGLVYAQYAYYEQMNGLREFDIFGTTYSAHAYHQLTLGALFDSSTIPALNVAGRRGPP